MAQPAAAWATNPAEWRGGKYTSPGREPWVMRAKNAPEPRPLAGRQGSEAAESRRRMHRCGLAPYRPITGGRDSMLMLFCHPLRYAPGF